MPTETRADIAAESMIAAKELERLARELQACIAEASLGLTPALSRRDTEDLLDKVSQQRHVIECNRFAIEEAGT